MSSLPWPVLAVALVVFLFVLGKSANALVVQAVLLSKRLNISEVIIGATIVSLGTTLPEAAVSVMAAIRGYPGLALGNAVGSIICDTGLILGLACLIAPIPIDRHIVNRQGWLQFGAGTLLVLCSIPWSSPLSAFSNGGVLTQWAGIFFVMLLVAYIAISIRQAKSNAFAITADKRDTDDAKSTWPILAKIFAACLLVIASAHGLIMTATEVAVRMHVPESIIAASLVAFGTSLPELITAITAARKGHGRLALGNVIGADILNVLFVSGIAAAVTPQGLFAEPHFFKLLFPGMLGILIIFRLGILFSKQCLGRTIGVILIAAYAAIMTAGLR